MKQNKIIPLYRPPILTHANKALNDCFLSGWWGYGLACKELENRFTKQRGGWALATSSCTSALYIIARLLQQSPNDEIIVPAITWVSSAMAFLAAGFKVKVADVSPFDLMINLETIKPLVTKKTRAIVVVHLYGQEANVKQIGEFCKSNNIIMIEDCAHRIDIENTPLSDYCCYSFNTVKEIPCGEGGLIWSRKLDEENKARTISYLGMEVNTWERTSNTKHNDLVFSNSTGLKLQLHDLGASIANAMFASSKDSLNKRKKIFENYDNLLEDLLPKITLLNRNTSDSYLMYVIILNEMQRESVRDRMSLDGISTSVHYPSLSRHPLIEKSVTPIADMYSENILTLPCFPDLDFSEQHQVVQSLKRSL